MKNNYKELTKIDNELYYYDNGTKILIDKNNNATYPSNIWGNIDNCDISQEERLKGIDIEDLIK